MAEVMHMYSVSFNNCNPTQVFVSEQSHQAAIDCVFTEHPEEGVHTVKTSTEYLGKYKKVIDEEGRLGFVRFYGTEAGE